MQKTKVMQIIFPLSIYLFRCSPYAKPSSSSLVETDNDRKNKLLLRTVNTTECDPYLVASVYFVKEG